MVSRSIESDPIDLGWVKGRNDCWKSDDMRGCVEENYRRRIVELQARYRLVQGSAAITYVCDGNPANEITATFFQTNPPTLIAGRGDSVSLMYRQPGRSAPATRVATSPSGNRMTKHWLPGAMTDRSCTAREPGKGLVSCPITESRLAGIDELATGSLSICPGVRAGQEYAAGVTADCLASRPQHKNWRCLEISGNNVLLVFLLRNPDGR